ncbi:MAG TPA: DUF2795 domain-containing protein [Pilimelia sp.]|nr:DUF2795 domain-containing protein [Pilimelia sp.]
MERGSTKHSPRLDEEMAQEVRSHLQGGVAGSRAQEWHEPEPSGEDQPAVTQIPAGERPGGAPGALTGAQVEQRSRIGRFLGLSALPGDRAGLLAAARANQAPDDVLSALADLPAEGTFRTVNEIWAALGHPVEDQRW